MQETKVSSNLDENALSFKVYTFIEENVDTGKKQGQVHLSRMFRTYLF